MTETIAPAEHDHPIYQRCGTWCPSSRVDEATKADLMRTTDMDPIETVVPITDGAAYTELYRYADGTLGGHVEDGKIAAEPRWTLEQAKAFHAALGHLIWQAEYAQDEE
jgi:hypothetical protein